MTRRIWISLALALMLSAQLMAGVVYEFDVTDHLQSPPETSQSVLAAEGRNLKIGTGPVETGRAGIETIWGRTLDPAAFETPSGYKRRSTP